MQRPVPSLDPADWEVFRKQAHGALDGMIDHIRCIRQQPVWRPLPDLVKARLRSQTLPEEGEELAAVLDQFRTNILPYPSGNIHPRFWSWISGSGNPVGMIADMLASGMNSVGLGFDDSSASYVELQVMDWLKELFGFPSEASGLLVSGCSMANLVGLAVARGGMSGHDVRKAGVKGDHEGRLVTYASIETHSSIQRAVELLGLGSHYYRKLPVDDEYEIDLEALERQITSDKAQGLRPALLVGNAGTVNTGAIDPMNALADCAQRHDLWLHVDGAFGAMARLIDGSPRNLSGMTRADSLAFDLHKWLHQPYNVGAVIVRSADLHRQTFSIAPDYLENLGDGVAGGPTNFNSFGVELSRSFIALRIWMSFKTYGVKRFRELVGQNIEQAQYLHKLIDEETALEALAPTNLNVVNFRFDPGGLNDESLDSINREIIVSLQREGIAAPSSTRLGGRLSIRVGITNHRTRYEDLELLITEVLRIGRQVVQQR